MTATITLLRPGAPASILVVAADAVARCLVCDALRADGYRVIEASSGTDAAAVLAQIPIHLVLLLGREASDDRVAVAELIATLHQPPQMIVAGHDATDGRRGLGAAVEPDAVPGVVAVVREALNPY